MATLADIAAALNLNKTTVSKALNDSSDISRATKQRVLEEAERVGYTKHKRKKAPVERRNLVGVICPEIVSGYYARIATHLLPGIGKGAAGVFDAVESLRHHRRDGAAGH